jgi:hypothetical protein
MGKGAPLAEGEGRSRPRLTVGSALLGWALIVLMTLSLGVNPGHAAFALMIPARSVRPGGLFLLCRSN